MIVLASLAPFTALWYASTVDYNLAKLFNAAMFAVASVAAQALLWRFYTPLIRRHNAHRWMIWTWLSIYALIGIQMAWIGRPFIGSPDMSTSFFPGRRLVQRLCPSSSVVVVSSGRTVAVT